MFPSLRECSPADFDSLQKQTEQYYTFVFPLLYIDKHLLFITTTNKTFTQESQ